MKDKESLIVLGASGHGKVVAETAELLGYKRIVFLDDNEELTTCGKYRIKGRLSDVTKYSGDVFVAIGNATIRRELMEKYCDRHFPVIAHPNSVISETAEIGKGTVIMAGAVVNSNVSIGEGVILNTLSSVDHDSRIANYVHIAVGSHLCGNVYVGENSWIGAGATIINNVEVCANTCVGAGGVVIRNIDCSGTYIGVPARRMADENMDF